MLKSIAALLLASLTAHEGHARCQANELSLVWPVGGPDGKSWVINNYVDLDSGTGIRDYRNGAKSYNGHNGIDIDLPTTRSMDAGRIAFAAAAGTVIEVQDDLFDRHFEAPRGCGPWNHVYIQHENGFVTWYGHLKFGSVRVRVGERVAVNAALGEIGSSGCSSTAHLHFEVRDCSNQVVDPFQQGLFSNPPAYDPPLSLMDLNVRKGGFPTSSKDAAIKDPNPNIFRITPGTRVGVGLSVAGGRSRETLDVRILNPNGSVYTQFTPLVANGTERHWWPRWWVDMPKPMAAGNYKVQVRINSNVVEEKNLTSQPTPDAVVFAKTDEAYQENFESLRDAGYSPLVVDGSPAIEGRARFTAIYRHQGGQFRTFHNIDDANYRTAYQSARAAGLQLRSIDNYIRDGQPRIAAVFGLPITSDWVGYHFSDRNEHPQNFERMRSQGYRPYAISVAVGGGRHWISSAYTKTPSRGWTARYDLTLAQYQQLFDSEKRAGRGLDYIDIYQDGGIPKVSAIWTAEASDWPWEVRHNLSEAQFHSVNETNQQAGRKMRWVTSYLENRERKFAAIWRGGP